MGFLDYTVHTPDRTDVKVEELGANDHACREMLGEDERDSEVRFAQPKSENHHAQELEISAVCVTQSRKMSQGVDILTPADGNYVEVDEVRITPPQYCELHEAYAYPDNPI